MIKAAKELKGLVEIIELGGCVSASSWSYGKGRYTKRRVTPNGCTEYEAIKLNKMIEKDIYSVPSYVRKFLKENPKCRIVICVSF